MSTMDSLPLFSQWLKEVLSAPVPDGVAAFHFNLYESPDAHALELVGCPVYDATNSDWACDDIFMSKRPRFELSHDLVGSSWEQGLAAASRLISALLALDCAETERLKMSQAVSVGYVDGDLHVLWARGDA